MLHYVIKISGCCIKSPLNIRILFEIWERCYLQGMSSLCQYSTYTFCELSSLPLLLSHAPVLFVLTEPPDNLGLGESLTRPLQGCAALLDQRPGSPRQPTSFTSFAVAYEALRRAIHDRSYCTATLATSNTSPSSIKPACQPPSTLVLHCAVPACGTRRCREYLS
jgi:hypothetical protein